MLDCLKTVSNRAKTVEHPIRKFLSDGGGDSDNLDVKKLLHEQVVTHRITAPYTPQQNGNTERENKAIVEMACTFC